MRNNYLGNTKVLNRRYKDIHKPVIILSSDGGNMGVIKTSSVSTYGKKMSQAERDQALPIWRKDDTHACTWKRR